MKNIRNLYVSINLMDSFWAKAGLVYAVRNPGLKSGVIYVCYLMI